MGRRSENRACAGALGRYRQWYLTVLYCTEHFALGRSGLCGAHRRVPEKWEEAEVPGLSLWPGPPGNQTPHSTGEQSGQVPGPRSGPIMGAMYLAIMGTMQSLFACSWPTTVSAWPLCLLGVVPAAAVPAAAVPACSAAIPPARPCVSMCLRGEGTRYLRDTSFFFFPALLYYFLFRRNKCFYCIFLGSFLLFPCPIGYVPSLSAPPSPSHASTGRAPPNCQTPRHPCPPLIDPISPVLSTLPFDLPFPFINSIFQSFLLFGPHHRPTHTLFYNRRRAR